MITSQKDAEGKAKLTIPGELPTMNEIIDASKQHWAKYKQMKDDLSEQS